ncbi:MAG: rod shape-determining protein RodA, partial [Arcobacter sp.]|nr:rod shape-determining protein RodA [Arcobacter sp.]
EKPSYHVQQSIIAIGSGGLTGKLSEDATQTQLKFLPIATSDFIFAYFVERYGFLGAIGLIFLYGLLITHLLTLNYYFKDDYVIRVFASGLGLLLFFNMSVNILMVIGFAPVVGLPLPLFSYGGSSFINFIVIFAILENLLAFRYMDLYNYERKL